MVHSVVCASQKRWLGDSGRRLRLHRLLYWLRGTRGWVTLSGLFGSHHKFAFQCLGESHLVFHKKYRRWCLVEEWVRFFGWNNPKKTKRIPQLHLFSSRLNYRWWRISLFLNGVARPSTLLNVHTAILRHGNILPQLWKRDFKKRTIVSSAFCNSELFLPMQRWSDTTLSSGLLITDSLAAQKLHIHCLPDFTMKWFCLSVRPWVLTELCVCLQVCVCVRVSVYQLSW